MGASVPANILSIPTKRLTPAAKLPTYGSAEAAGMDLYVDLSGMVGYDAEQDPAEGVVFTLYAGQRALLETNIAMEIPTGYYGQIKPRSGLAYKNGIVVLGGVIDSDYRDGIGVILLNSGKENVQFKHNDRIAQMVLLEHYTGHLFEVDELGDTVRGTGGFGSTGA
jgi:dUTP pyrophosphatase